MIGIYGIKNKKTNKIYIGQSIKIEKRWDQHKRELRSGKHYNEYLLNSFNKYGENCFDFLILEECLESELNFKEEEWINKFSKTDLYNQNFHIFDLRGFNNPFYGKKHTKESKEKMSKWKSKNFVGEKNPNFGKKWSFENRVKNTLKHPQTKLNKENVLKIKDLLIEGKLKDADIAKIFNVSRTVVTRIASGDRWSNVTGGKILDRERRGLRLKGTKRKNKS